MATISCIGQQWNFGSVIMRHNIIIKVVQKQVRVLAIVVTMYLHCRSLRNVSSSYQED